MTFRQNGFRQNVMDQSLFDYFEVSLNCQIYQGLSVVYHLSTCMPEVPGLFAKRSR